MKVKNKILFLLTCVVINLDMAHATLYGFCFDKKIKLQEAHQYLNEILLSRDTVFYRDSKNCLEIELSENRKELVERFLYKRYSSVEIYGDAPSVLTTDYNKTCKIQLIKKASGVKEQQIVKVGRTNKAVITNVKEDESSIMEMVVTQGLRGKLQMDEEELEIICKELGSGKYQLEVFVKTGGDNQTSQVTTNVLIESGIPFEIGSVVKDLKNKDKKISSEEGFQHIKTDGDQNTTFHILIK